mmetsp:Transcript_4445/g.6571  ORF Transcript_4445/g.6571 Transcript_4445/m.6571 type:complete len:188 (+) Transcript_4445:311-874(+)
MLNEDLFGEALTLTNYFEHLFAQMAEGKAYPNEKERYLLTALPNVYLAQTALLAYQSRESFGFLNSILAFSMETAEFSVDFFNDYTLTMRGRASQGVTQFKNQMMALTEESKKKSTKPDVSEPQAKMNIPKVFNLHGQLGDKATQYCMQLQNEINSDEASIFQNKKYKQLLVLAGQQQAEMCQQIQD